MDTFLAIVFALAFCTALYMLVLTARRKSRKGRPEFFRTSIPWLALTVINFICLLRHALPLIWPGMPEEAATVLRVESWAGAGIAVLMSIGSVIKDAAWILRDSRQDKQSKQP